MTMIIDISTSRGKAQHGWLNSRHTFSFGDYHNPDRMGFGLLRVLNDDIVEPSSGFATHAHRDMEIISIPLSGSLKHKDNMGNEHVIAAGEVQIMSAGSGITHSEYNNSEQHEVNFLQVWVMPEKKGIEPRYDQRDIDLNEADNNFHLVVAPMGTENVININQQARFSIANIDSGSSVSYKKQNSSNGVYCFIINGSVSIDSKTFLRRDGVGIVDEDNIEVIAIDKANVLCIEVPMS